MEWVSNNNHYKEYYKIIYPSLHLNGGAAEFWEWKNTFIPYFIMDVITYPCWD